MRIRPKSMELPTREEALAGGLRFYGDASEVHMPLSEAAAEGEVGDLIGTRIAMIEAETGHTVLSTTVEIAYSRSQKAYERDVRKTTDREAGTIQEYNRLASRANAS